MKQPTIRRDAGMRVDCLFLLVFSIALLVGIGLGHAFGMRMRRGKYGNPQFGSPHHKFPKGFGGALLVIEAFLAGREELGPNGFFLWGALIRVDGVVTWTGADCIGRGPQCSVAKAQYTGAVEVLKNLRALREQNPASISISMYADSRPLVEELREEWQQSQCENSAILDQAIELLHSVAPLTLRYCSLNANLAAHELISELCKRHGVAVRERYIRRSRERQE